MNMFFWKAAVSGKLDKFTAGLINRIRIFLGSKIKCGKQPYWLLSENIGLHNSNIFYILCD